MPSDGLRGGSSALSTELARCLTKFISQNVELVEAAPTVSSLFKREGGRSSVFFSSLRQVVSIIFCVMAFASQQYPISEQLFFVAQRCADARPARAGVLRT